MFDIGICDIDNIFGNFNLVYEGYFYRDFLGFCVDYVNIIVNFFVIMDEDFMI